MNIDGLRVVPHSFDESCSRKRSLAYHCVVCYF